MSKEIEQGNGGAQEEAQPTPADSITPSPLVAALQRQNPEWVGASLEAFDEVTVIVPRAKIVEICSFLKTAPGLEFNMLADLCAADRGPEEEPRFEVNYHLF